LYIFPKRFKIQYRPITYNKPTRCNSGSTVRTELDIYTGFIPIQLMTNTSGCCYNL